MFCLKVAQRDPRLIAPKPEQQLLYAPEYVSLTVEILSCIAGHLGKGF